MSKSEISFAVSSLLANPPLRSDGRGLLDFRPIHVDCGVYPQASGSARVECGGSQVVVGVMAVVTNVEDESPSAQRGSIKCNVTCTPSAYPSHTGATLDELSEDYTSILTDVYSSPSLLPQSLIIIEKKKCWTLHIDALVLSDGGNILDVLFIAARAALCDCRIPVTKSVQYKAQSGIGTGTKESGLDTRTTMRSQAADFEISDYWDDGQLLENRDDFPIAVTLNILSGTHFLDSTTLENSATPSKLLLLFSFRSQAGSDQLTPVLMSMRNFGEGTLKSAAFRDLVTRGEKYASGLRAALDYRISEESSSKQTNARR